MNNDMIARAGTPRQTVLRLVPHADRQIVIEPEPFGWGFDIRVVPVCDGPGHDCERPDYPSARAYAERLSAATGWPITDLTGKGAAGGDSR